LNLPMMENALKNIFVSKKQNLKHAKKKSCVFT
jgi:hypothetical protein